MPPSILTPILTPRLMDLLCEDSKLPPHSWYIIAAATLTILNRPDEIPRIYEQAYTFASSVNTPMPDPVQDGRGFDQDKCYWGSTEGDFFCMLDQHHRADQTRLLIRCWLLRMSPNFIYSIVHSCTRPLSGGLSLMNHLVLNNEEWSSLEWCTVKLRTGS